MDNVKTVYPAPPPPHTHTNTVCKGYNNAGGMANSVDPDQTACEGAFWLGSTLFAQTFGLDLSVNYGIWKISEFKIVG